MKTHKMASNDAHKNSALPSEIHKTISQIPISGVYSLESLAFTIILNMIIIINNLR